MSSCRDGIDFNFVKISQEKRSRFFDTLYAVINERYKRLVWYSYFKMFGRLIPPEITYLREARIIQQEKKEDKNRI